MKKNKLIIVAIVVLLLGVSLAGGCVQKQTGTPIIPEEEATEPLVEETEKTPVEIYFDNTKVVEPQSEKGQAVNAVLLPALKEVYDIEVDGKIINQVKLKEEFGPMLTYIFNRVIVDADMTIIKTKLESAGFQTGEFSGKGMTMTKTGSNWVFTFQIDNQEKALLEVTY